MLNSFGTVTRSLACGASYIGGGQSQVPPAVVPDLATSHFAVTSCNETSGAIALGPTTLADTGSTRTCTSPGCFVGPPVPIATRAPRRPARAR